MSNRIRFADLLLAGLLALACSPATARAGIPIIYGHGDTVAHVANLPAGHPAQLGRPGSAVGYHYLRYHIYWCDLWTSSGQYCVYHENTFVPLGNDAKEAAFKLGMPEDSLRRPVFYLFPLGWVLIGGFVAVSTTVGVIQKRNSPLARAERLLKQPLYQEACQVAGSGPNGFENAVSFLVGRGLAQDKAYDNMQLLAAYLNAMAPPPAPPSQHNAPLDEIPLDA